MFYILAKLEEQLWLSTHASMFIFYNYSLKIILPIMWNNIILTMRGKICLEVFNRLILSHKCFYDVIKHKVLFCGKTNQSVGINLASGLVISFFGWRTIRWSPTCSMTATWVGNKTKSIYWTFSPQKRLQRFLSRHGSNESGPPSNTEHQRIRSVGSADLDHPKKDRPRNQDKPFVKSHSHLAVAKKESSAG